MADLTMYTMANPEILAAALEGIAMVFDPNNTDVWVSDPGTSNGFGLGAVAGVGMVITLFIILVRGVMTQKLEIWNFLIVLVVYTMAFVPKTTLQVERIQDGQIEVVDGIPYGVAIPAALMSGMMKAITETFETAFQDPRVGSFNDTGFMDPLKVLGQMRGVATAAAGGNGYLKQNMIKYIEICMIDAKTGTTLNVEAMVRKAGTLANLFDETKIKSGIVPLYKKVGDDLVLSYHSCNKPIGGQLSGAETLRLQIQDYIGGASIVNGQFTGLEADLRLGGALKELSASNSAREAVKDSIATIAGMAAISTDVALQDLVVGSLMREAAQGLNVDDPTQVRMVMALTEGMERWRADSAGSGSMFLQTMQSSMDVMLFIWIALSPILATVFIIMGMQGIQMLGKYFMFGVWTQSWMPFAMVINYYMQITLSDKIARQMMPGTSIADLFSPGNQVQLYDELANTVAASSQLLAFTPVLSLAILTGSYMALSNLGTAMSGKDGYFDEKKVAGDADVATGAKAVTDRLSTMGMAGDAGVRALAGSGDALVGHVATSMGSVSTSTAMNSMQGIATQAKQAAQIASEAAYQQVYGTDTAHMKSAMEAVRAQYGKISNHTRDSAAKALEGMGVSNTESMTAEEKTQLLAAAQVSSSAGFKPLGIGVAVDASIKSDASKSDSFRKGLETINNRQWSEEEAARLQNGVTASKGKEYASQQQESTTEALKKAHQNTEKWQKNKALEETASSQAQALAGTGSAWAAQNSDLTAKLSERTHFGAMPKHELATMLNGAGVEGQNRKIFDDAFNQAGGGWKGMVMGAAALMSNQDLGAQAAGNDLMASLTDRANIGTHVGDQFRSSAQALRSVQQIGGERMAEGQAVAGAVDAGIQATQAAITAGGGSINSRNAALRGAVETGTSEATFAAAAANHGRLQDTAGAVLTAPADSAVQQAGALMRVETAGNQNDSVTAQALGIVQSGRDYVNGAINLVSGTLGAYGVGGIGGWEGDYKAAMGRVQEQEAILGAGQALKDAQTPEQQANAVAAYARATGYEGELPSDPSTVAANREAMLRDFDGGRGANARIKADAAREEARQYKVNLDLALQQADRGGDQIAQDRVGGMPGYTPLRNTSTLPGMTKPEDLSDEVIDAVGPDVGNK